MALSQEFKTAVSNQDLLLVRIMLKDMMLLDLSLETFHEMLSYAEEHMENLYDEHDGEEFKCPDEWTEHYMNQQMVAVVTNFSRERVAALEKIVKHLYGSRVTEMKAQEAKQSSASIPVTGQRIAGGVVAVGGAGALVGGIIGLNIPIAIVGGVALVGGAILFATGGKKEG